MVYDFHAMPAEDPKNIYIEAVSDAAKALLEKHCGQGVVGITLARHNAQPFHKARIDAGLDILYRKGA